MAGGDFYNESIRPVAILGVEIESVSAGTWLNILSNSNHRSHTVTRCYDPDKGEERSIVCEAGAMHRVMVRIPGWRDAEVFGRLLEVAKEVSPSDS
jgi:hypothetical protein